MIQEKIVRDSFLSSDKTHQIPYALFVPEEGISKGIVQIVHGMSEFSARYEENGTVTAFVDAGYVVCLSDHLGHGGAVLNASEYGDFPSCSNLIEDLRTLHDILRKRYRYLPYFMLGHSMGSFLVREYINLHPDELNGVILSGTCAGESPVGAALFVSKVAKMLGMGQKPLPLIQNVMYSTLSSAVKSKDRLGWIVSDPTCLDALRGREDYGFPFTARAYASLFALMKHISNEEVIEEMPRSVPILLCSGSHDPVGGMEKGIKDLYDRFFEAGIDDLSVKIYEGARHEILNEPAHKEQVLADMIAFVDEECENYRQARLVGQLLF